MFVWEKKGGLYFYSFGLFMRCVCSSLYIRMKKKIFPQKHSHTHKSKRLRCREKRKEEKRKKEKKKRAATYSKFGLFQNSRTAISEITSSPLLLLPSLYLYLYLCLGCESLLQSHFWSATRSFAECGFSGTGSFEFGGQ